MAKSDAAASLQVAGGLARRAGRATALVARAAGEPAGYLNPLDGAAGRNLALARFVRRSLQSLRRLSILAGRWMQMP